MSGLHGSCHGEWHEVAYWEVGNANKMTDMSARHIICFGNPLHGDDGFGTAVCEALQRQELPEGTKVMDGGTSSLSALNLFDGCSRAIIVDAMEDADDPGRLSWFDVDAFESLSDGNRMSSHGLGVTSILQGLRILQEEGAPVPELEILTCSVEKPESFRMDLSPAVANAVPIAIDQIMDKLREVGQ